MSVPTYDSISKTASRLVDQVNRARASEGKGNPATVSDGVRRPVFSTVDKPTGRKGKPVMNVDLSCTNAKENCKSTSSGRIDASVATRICLHLDQMGGGGDLQKTCKQIEISCEFQSNAVQP